MTSGVKVPEQLRGIARLARRQGWDIVRQRNSHLCWISPDGRRFINSSTPSCYKGVKNFVSRLQREGGLVIPRG